MNTTIKLGIASALALGGTAAHAQIAAPSTGSSTVVLFAEILNSSNAVVASYGGNTGVSVASAYAGTNATFAATNNLSALFAADASGDTLVWGVEGSAYTGSTSNQAQPGYAKIVTTAPNPEQISNQNYGSITAIESGLSNTITALNTNLGSGVDVEAASAANGGVWDSNSNNSDLGAISSVITGTGTVGLYSLTGPGSKTAYLATTTNGTVTLSSAGLVFATGGGGGSPPPVPLPPAVWLLGSGLLGLAGVARRKTKV